MIFKFYYFGRIRLFPKGIYGIPAFKVLCQILLTDSHLFYSILQAQYESFLVFKFSPIIIYSAIGRDVRDVIINGKIFCRDRYFITLDRDDIMNEVKRLSGRIKNS